MPETVLILILTPVVWLLIVGLGCVYGWREW